VNNTKKCVDLDGSTARGTGLVINDCNSSSTQAWTITPDAKTGAFVFKNAGAGRCMDEAGSNTASGLQMDIYDCNGGSNQKFNIQAY
jgi:Ricin-type beta-trefoil lectin domain-like